MDEKDFTDKIVYNTYICSKTGRAYVRAIIKFQAEQTIDLKTYNSSVEEYAKEKLKIMLMRHIYDNRYSEMAEALHEFFSCSEMAFFPSNKMMEARDRILDAAKMTTTDIYNLYRD